MSSFVVKPQTMNRILSFLDEEVAGSGIHGHAYREVLAKYLIIPSRDARLEEKTLQQLAKASIRLKKPMEFL